MSIPLDILTVLKPHFPPSGQVLAQGVRINEERWREVATQTGDLEVAWVIDNLPPPITRSDIQFVYAGLAGPGRRRWRGIIPRHLS